MSAELDANVFGCHFPKPFASPELSVAPMESAPHLFKDYFAVAAMRPTAFVFYSRINDFAGAEVKASTGSAKTYVPAYFFGQDAEYTSTGSVIRKSSCLYYFAGGPEVCLYGERITTGFAGLLFLRSGGLSLRGETPTAPLTFLGRTRNIPRSLSPIQSGREKKQHPFAGLLFLRSGGLSLRGETTIRSALNLK